MSVAAVAAGLGEPSPPARRKASARIKLSRELMLRLAAALRQQSPAANTCSTRAEEACHPLPAKQSKPGNANLATNWRTHASACDLNSRDALPTPATVLAGRPTMPTVQQPRWRRQQVAEIKAAPSPPLSLLALPAASSSSSSELPPVMAASRTGDRRSCSPSESRPSGTTVAATTTTTTTCHRRSVKENDRQQVTDGWLRDSNAAKRNGPATIWVKRLPDRRIQTPTSKQRTVISQSSGAVKRRPPPKDTARQQDDEPSKCDSGRFGRRRQSAFSSRTGLWLLLALGWFLLAAWLPSPLELVSGQATSDELNRAVLDTMSTRAPNAEPPNRTSSGELVVQDDGGQLKLPPMGAGQQDDWLERTLQFCRIFIMSAIIVGDICGNSLVILSVCRHSKLRVTTNWFVVSLACADILVALFAMTFNASVIISGRWLFPRWVCDFWNSCDVLASTASILHLCCISIDRYIAIMRPLDYPMKITTRRVVYALCGVWISSALLSYIPIFTGIYTTAEHIRWLKANPDQCEFVVNRVYAVVSSSISFWIPCCIMVFTYYRIYREATRQEKFIYKAQSIMPAPQQNHQQQHHSNHHKQRRSKSVAVQSASQGANLATNEARIRHLARQQQQELLANKPAVQTTSLALEADRSSSLLQLNQAGQQQQQPTSGQSETRPLQQQPTKLQPPQVKLNDQLTDEMDDEAADTNSGQSTPTKRSISKMKREHKAAKTLGIIMGVFILCWLPFFSWYTPQHICGHACDGMVPRGAVTILFWIGYFNSTLNPIIYAYFNHEFRDAFKKTLQWIFCCCQDLKCLRVNRPNDNQHYNCTYRSTQEIGLVNNS